MKDIKSLALEHGDTCYQGQQYHFDLHELEAFAKALQGDVGEPVAWMFKGAGIVSFGEMSEMPPRAIGAVKDATIYKLYTSPPNTSAKLDKAIEALKQARANITWTDGSRAYYKLVGLIDEALKELE